MKGKLIKLNLGPGYRLNDEDGNLFGSTLAFSKTKLSKQNCNEIFGVVDVESEFYKIQPNTLSPETEHKVKVGFTMGFNKAMELNKDKLFTIEDMKKAISFGQGMDLWKEEEQIDKFIQSRQQPTEIEVEIEMEMTPVWGDKYDMRVTYIPKLDSAGCLILKKI